MTLQKPIFYNKSIPVKNDYWEVHQSDFEDSHGRTGNIITMKSTKQGDGSFILALTADNKIILNREYRFGPDDFIYSLPSGFIEKGLTGEENILKELKEETGYTTNNQVIHLGKTIQNGYLHGFNQLFYTTNCIKNYEQETHVGEEIETCLVSIKEFETMLGTNKIHCPYSEICYYRAKKITNNFINICIIGKIK